MSIIVTQINKFGIVFGSDSNITSDEKVEFSGKKIFEIPSLKSAMCIAGTYEVGNKRLDSWLPEFIDNEKSNYSSLKEFVELLSKSFENNMTQEEKNELSICHIAGYVDGHPEMWCLSNTNLSDDGEYDSGCNTFHYSEDFWNRDWGNNNLKELFESNGLNYQIYVNSSTQGRVAFNMVRSYLDVYFSAMFLSRFKFRYPKNLKEHSFLVKIYIDVIDTMYKLSDYEPKEIGGETQLFIIHNS